MGAYCREHGPTGTIVPTAYSAVVMPASSRTSRRNFLIM
jgi:hypothetical protein